MTVDHRGRRVHVHEPPHGGAGVRRGGPSRTGAGCKAPRGRVRIHAPTVAGPGRGGAPAGQSVGPQASRLPAGNGTRSAHRVDPSRTAPGPGRGDRRGAMTFPSSRARHGWAVAALRRGLTVWLGGLLLAAPALGATYYVSPTGSDSGAGTVGPRRRPWATLANANAAWRRRRRGPGHRQLRVGPHRARRQRQLVQPLHHLRRAGQSRGLDDRSGTSSFVTRSSSPT